MLILVRAAGNGRGVKIFVERDARQPIAAVAEPLSSVAAGDIFRSESGHSASARFLEPVLEGKKTVFQVSSLDA
jgi:hypothetical protein